MIYDCLIGDATLFQRADNIEAGWSVVQPVLDAWSAGHGELCFYAAGKPGPDEAEALRNLLVREALGYGLASAETAFLAVRTEAGRVVEGRVAVANALPAGWSEDFLTRSALITSAGAPAKWGLSPIMYEAFPPPMAAADTTTDFLDLSPLSEAPANPTRKMRDRSLARGAKRAPKVTGTSPTVVFQGVPALTGGE